MKVVLFLSLIFPLQTVLGKGQGAVRGARALSGQNNNHGEPHLQSDRALFEEEDVFFRAFVVEELSMSTPFPSSTPTRISHLTTVPSAVPVETAPSVAPIKNGISTAVPSDAPPETAPSVAPTKNGISTAVPSDTPPETAPSVAPTKNGISTAVPSDAPPETAPSVAPTKNGISTAVPSDTPPETAPSVSPTKSSISTTPPSALSKQSGCVDQRISDVAFIFSSAGQDLITCDNPGTFSSQAVFESATSQAYCANGWHICRGDDPVIQSITYVTARNFSGCYAFNAAHDCGRCFATCGNFTQDVNGNPSPDCMDTLVGADMGGMGESCSFHLPPTSASSLAASCFTDGRVDASTNTFGCFLNPGLTGLLCCSDTQSSSLVPALTPSSVPSSAPTPLSSSVMSSDRPSTDPVSDTPSGLCSSDGVRIPGKIEAEDFCDSAGIEVEETRDEGGGSNIGYIDAGDFVAFSIQVEVEGTYEVLYRVASPSGDGGLILELEDGGFLGTVDSFPNTGDWQNWETISGIVAMPPGSHTLVVKVTAPGWNLNWLEIKDFEPSDPTSSPSATPSATFVPSLSPSLSVAPTLTSMPSSVPSVSTVPSTSQPTRSPIIVPSDYGGFLRTQGKSIVTEEGDPIILRAYGFGSWMVQEPYMLLVEGIATAGQHSMFEDIEELIGPDNFEIYRQAWLDNYCTEADVMELARSGFNSLRAPLHYNLFTLPIEEEPVLGQDTWLSEGFERLDSLLKWCQNAGIYLILDLHAAPGGQGINADINDYDSKLHRMALTRYFDYSNVIGLTMFYTLCTLQAPNHRSGKMVKMSEKRLRSGRSWRRATATRATLVDTIYSMR